MMYSLIFHENRNILIECIGVPAVTETELPCDLLMKLILLTHVVFCSVNNNKICVCC